MKKILIEDMIDVCNFMYDKIENGYASVSFVGKYEDARVLIKELLIDNDETFITCADIEPNGLYSYNKEYIVSLDNEMNVWVEKAYDEDDKCYIWVGDDCVLVADDCNSALLKSIDSKEVYEVSYDLDEPYGCDENCKHCSDGHEVITRVATDDNGKLRGFEKSWSTEEDGIHYHSTYTYYSNNEDMLKTMMNNFDIKY